MHPEKKGEMLMLSFYFLFIFSAGFNKLRKKHVKIKQNVKKGLSSSSIGDE